jgi:hypothetical protein
MHMQSTRRREIMNRSIATTALETLGERGSIMNFKQRFLAAARSTRTCRALVAALAVASLCIAAATASADDFSPFSTQAGTPLAQNWTFQGCSIRVGPIFDPHPMATGYHTIGAARVICPTSGHTIGITVQEDYWNGYAPVLWTSASHVMAGSWNMVETPPYCSGRGGFQWKTYAYITIDGYGSWVNSPWSDPKRDGC